MADYSEVTALGYKIVAKLIHPHFTHVIAERSDTDYVICWNYDKTDGTWGQGIYGYDTLDDAWNDVIEELS